MYIRVLLFNQIAVGQISIMENSNYGLFEFNKMWAIIRIFPSGKYVKYCLMFRGFLQYFVRRN